MATRRKYPAYRTQENERSAEALATRGTNPAERRQEHFLEPNQRRSTRHTNPASRRQEQISYTAQRRLAREQQPLWYDMATKFNSSSGTYLYKGNH
jgi:hypothetical protein